jgi:hypothetical protein
MAVINREWRSSTSGRVIKQARLSYIESCLLILRELGETAPADLQSLNNGLD